MASATSIFYLLSIHSRAKPERVFPDNTTHYWNPGSVVRIATGYGLDDRGIGVRVAVVSRMSVHGAIKSKFYAGATHIL
jgi:hypothetical protein